MKNTPSYGVACGAGAKLGMALEAGSNTRDLDRWRSSDGDGRQNRCWSISLHLFTGEG
jgi:hypothetical protein